MKSRKCRIQTLQRRADHLARRIAEQDGGRNLSYDKDELSCLLWAIRELSENLEADIAARKERHEEAIP